MKDETVKHAAVKANCYKCVYRGEVPGDVHSCCNHPLLGEKDNNPFGAMVQMMGGKFKEAIHTLEIRGNPQGIRNGWFMWPANFDPVWLENCLGYKAKA